MPTYDYSCRGCGFVVEIWCKIADRPEPWPCPECGGEVRQDMSVAQVQCDDMVNVPWIRDFAKHHNRQRGGKKPRDRTGGPPIQSRSDYNRYLQTHDLRPCGDGVNLSEV